ncbi:CotH kinase family protein [Bacteroidota bacterium]
MRKALSLAVFSILLSLPLNSQNIKEYFITCDPEDLNYINDNYEEDIYIPVSIEYNAQKWTDCRMRIRGDGSRRYSKKSLKIKFDDDAFHTDRKVLNLNANMDDRSYMHCYIAYRLFSAIGYPCIKVEHVRVYINAVYSGLFIQIENVDEDFLVSREYSPIGNLYKATHDGASLASEKEVYSLWEKKTYESSDRQDLIELINNLNAVSDSEFYQYAKKTYDYDKLVTILAMNMLIANGSTYTHNYYMYHDSLKSGKWIMFPWDFDKIFYHYTIRYEYCPTPDVWLPDNPLLKKSMMCEQVFTDIKNKSDSIVHTVFNEEFLIPIIDSLTNALKESVINDTNDLIEDYAYWEEIIGKDRYFIKNRYNSLLNQFNVRPLQFKVDKTPDVITGPVTFKWHPSASPRGLDISYDVFIGTKPFFVEGVSYLYKGIKDTIFTFNEKLTEGIKYYWNITATDGELSTIGFNRLNIFYYKKPTLIPCEITNELILTKEKSPYVADCDIYVRKDGKLVFSPGTELRLPDGAYITVDGEIVLKGTIDEPIRIMPVYGANYWNLRIKLNNKKLEIKNVNFDYGTLLISDGTVDVENVKMKHKIPEGLKIPELFKIENCYGQVIHSDFVVEDNTASYNNGQGLFFFNSDGEVKECNFYGVSDAIEFSNSNYGFISGNRIFNSYDDGIDLNDCNNMSVENNFIYNCKDKGISLGTSLVGICDNVIISRNIILECNIATALKNQINSVYSNNTLYNNINGLFYSESPENNEFPDMIINNIFVGTESVEINFDSWDYAILGYNLSDKSNLPGTNNLFDAPLFIDVDKNNFRLKYNSPCINAGDPDSELDPDGTRADIGAFYFNMANNDIVINEINYNSSESHDTEDWIELYNPTSTNVDLSYWVFCDENDTHKFYFPEETQIKPFGFIILCRDLNKFLEYHPDEKVCLGDFDFGLSGSGELIRLYNLDGKLIDSVEYDDKLPWPENADGNGPTLELISSDIDNTNPNNWRAYDGYGTPGEENLHLDVKELNNFFLSVYPNPFSDILIFEINLENSGIVKIEIFDMKGYLIYNINDYYLLKGKNLLTWHPYNISNGIFFYRITYGTIIETGKIILKSKF